MDDSAWVTRRSKARSGNSRKRASMILPSSAASILLLWCCKRCPADKMFEVLLLLSLRRDGMIDDSGVFVYGGFWDSSKAGFKNILFNAGA